MKPVDQFSDDEFVQLAQRAAALPDAPPALVRAALGLWPSAPTVSPVDIAAATLRLVRAMLSFDSWASSPLAAGMRATGSATRHLLFSADGRDIDLRISPAAQTYALTGQILGPDETGVIALAAQRDDGSEAPEVRLAVLDELGEFRLDGVVSGTYVMTLRVGNDEILLPPIAVGAHP